MILSADKIYRLARNAGFPVGVAVQMVAIALRESAGDTLAHLVGPVDDSYGLWQINMLGRLGPARRKQFGIAANYQLFDPATNARAAFLTWGGSYRNMTIAWAIDRGIWRVRYQGHMGAAIAGAIAAGEDPKIVLVAVTSVVGSPGVPVGMGLSQSASLAENDWLRDLFEENSATKQLLSAAA